MAVAMKALVVAGELAEVGGRPGGGHGLLVSSADGSGVVAHVLQGSVNYRVAVRHDIKLGQEGGLLQVAVGDVSCEDFRHGHKGRLHVREGRPSASSGRGRCGRKYTPPMPARAASVAPRRVGSARVPARPGEWGESSEAGGKACEGVEVAADKGVQALTRLAPALF